MEDITDVVEPDGASEVPVAPPGDEFDALMKRAEEAISQKDWQQARSLFEQALALPHIDEDERQRAKRLCDIAVSELKAEQAMVVLREASEGTGDIKEACKQYRSIPKGHRHHREATRLYRQICLQAPEPRSEPRKPPPLTKAEAEKVYEEAYKAYVKSHFREAYNKCILAYPALRTAKVGQLCGMVACKLNKPDKAKTYYSQLAGQHRKGLGQFCMQEGIRLD